MNIYARIRKIEDEKMFKRLFDAIMTATYEDFQQVKDWHDYGVDGYRKSTATVYQVYCPTYPERTPLESYKKKVSDSLRKLKTAVDRRLFTQPISEWVFVTPDDLSVDTIEYIHTKAKEILNIDSSLGMTAYLMGAIFSELSNLHIEFPELTAGLVQDKVPSVRIYPVNNRGYSALEIFNNGTEDLEDLVISTDNSGRMQRSESNFRFENENPLHGKGHSCITLRKGERQYLMGVPPVGGYTCEVSAIGVESKKTFRDRIQIPQINTN